MISIELIIEALVVGIVIVISGHIVGHFLKVKSNPILIFFTGILTHFAFEFLGFNKWYCKNGFACKS